MGLAQKHALAERSAIRIKAESSFGTYARPTTGSPGGSLFESFEADKIPEQIPVEDYNETSSDPNETVQGMTKVTWSGKKKFRPNGTLGVAPDHDALMKLTFGGKRVVKKITIVNYAVGSGDTIAIALTRASGTTTTTLTEGVDFTAATSNTITAAALYAKMILIEGIVSGIEIGVGVFEYTSADDVISWTITISDANFATSAARRIEYLGTNTPGARGSCTIHRKTDTLMDAVIGAWVNKWSCSGANGSIPTESFEGGGKNIVSTVAGTVADSTVASNKFTVDASCVEVNSLIALRSANGTLRSNSGSGFLVTDVTGSTVTVDATHGGADTDTIEPFVPAYTPNGSVCPGVKGSFTFGGSSLEVLKYDIAHESGNAPEDQTCFTETVSDVVDGDRSTTAKLVIRCRADQAKILQNYRGDSSTTYAVRILIGRTTTDGAYVQIDLGKVFIETCPSKFPDKGMVDLEIGVRALASSRTANDAIVVGYGAAA